MTSIGRTVAAISLTLVALSICSNAIALGRRSYLEVDVEITRKPLSGGALSSQLLLEDMREAPYRERAYAQARLMNAYTALIEVQLKEARRERELNKPNYVKIIMDLNKAKFETERKERQQTKVEQVATLDKFAKMSPGIVEPVPTIKRQPSFARIVYAMKFKDWLIQSGYPTPMANAAYNHVLNSVVQPQAAAIECMNNMGLPKPKIQSAIVLIKRVSLK